MRPAVEIEPAPMVESPLNLDELLQNEEQRLTAGAVAAAEQAFGMGIGATAIPILILLALIFILSRNLILTMMVLVLAALLALGWASYVSNRAHAKAVERIYQQAILPALEGWAAANHCDLTALRQAARQHLPAGALLRRFLTPEE